MSRDRNCNRPGRRAGAASGLYVRRISSWARATGWPTPVAWRSASRWDETYNPLFLYGNAGLGKDASAARGGPRACCHRLRRRRDPTAQLRGFRQPVHSRHRAGQSLGLSQPASHGGHCLMIDDVQFLREREQSQGGILPHVQRPCTTTASRSSSAPTIRLTKSPPSKRVLISRFNWGLCRTDRSAQLRNADRHRAGRRLVCAGSRSATKSLSTSPGRPRPTSANWRGRLTTIYALATTLHEPVTPRAGTDGAGRARSSWRTRHISISDIIEVVTRAFRRAAQRPPEQEAQPEHYACPGRSACT